MEGYTARFRNGCRTKYRRVVYSLGIICFLSLVCNSFILPSRLTLSPLFPTYLVSEEDTSLSNITSPEFIRTGNLSLLTDSQDETNSSLIVKKGEVTVASQKVENNGDQEMQGDSVKNKHSNIGFDLSEDENTDQFNGHIHENMQSKNILWPQKQYENQVQDEIEANSSGYAMANVVTTSGNHKSDIVASSHQLIPKDLPSTEPISTLQHVSTTTEIFPSILLVGKKKVMSPVSIVEMNRILVRNHVSSNSMRSKRISPCEKELLAVKALIETAPSVKNDRELYAPIFRNLSMFKRSYELMERTLKVYVYKEGKKPIFHQPLLKGIYATEGWFMKLMETNRHYVVKDPRKAHLFYVPFSSRLLQFALYVRNSHDRRNLEQYLKNHIDMIASKYPFWNRTGGSDHFIAACHDWAPYETKRTMKNSIRALCNADLNGGFQLGKDVSLPEIYIRSAQNPLRDLGGMPVTERPTLAFFAGNIHGRLRSLLLKHWEDKDPDMKILGPMLPGPERKMIYIHHMKTSKYCICPRGYEVNSPRVVESFYYECVPVIISDNYVPPFFEVLNWEAFSVVLAEEDVPRLKEILVSIPEEKYLALQKGVRMVQQHFLWHSKPIKYDLFNMILHSIWFNRLYQIR